MVPYTGHVERCLFGNSLKLAVSRAGGMFCGFARGGRFGRWGAVWMGRCRRFAALVVEFAVTWVWRLRLLAVAALQLGGAELRAVNQHAQRLI